MSLLDSGHTPKNARRGQGASVLWERIQAKTRTGTRGPCGRVQVQAIWKQAGSSGSRDPSAIGAVLRASDPSRVGTGSRHSPGNSSWRAGETHHNSKDHELPFQKTRTRRSESCGTEEEQIKCLTKIQNISGSGSENIAGSEIQGGGCSGRMRGRDSI